MTPEEYQALVKRMAPPSPIVRDTALAFLVGGAICVVGQLLSHWYGTLVPITGFANAVVSPAVDFRAEVRCIIGIVRENRNR